MIPLSDLVPGVRSTDDNLVLEVQSATRPRVWHRVDLAAFSGFGACSCQAYQFGIQKRVRKARIPLAVLECPHLPQARRYLAILVAQRLIQQRAQNPDPKMTRREWESPGF